jgi:hypothetical protein
LRGPKQTVLNIFVADTGCGIPPERLGSIFREFEDVESMGPPKMSSGGGVGLGLAVVARIVGQCVPSPFVANSLCSNDIHRLGGQLRVESKVDEGSRFSFLIPLALSVDGDELVMTSSPGPSSKNSSPMPLRKRSRKQSLDSAGKIDSLVEALSSSHIVAQEGYHRPAELPVTALTIKPGVFVVSDSSMPLRPVKVDSFTIDTPAAESQKTFPYVLDGSFSLQEPPLRAPPPAGPANLPIEDTSKLRVLIVEVMNQHLRPR